MKQDDKKRIVEILEYYGGLIGVDSFETDRLAIEVKKVRSATVNKELEQDIMGEIQDLCNQIGYVNTDENNASRDRSLVEMRDAVSKIVIDRHGDYDVACRCVAEFFCKDRSTGNAIHSRTINKLETKDSIFMHYYNQLAVSEFENAA